MSLAIPSDRSGPSTVFREPESPILPHVLLYVVQLIALASPQFRYRRAFFSLLIICLAGYAITHPYFTDDMATAQPFNIGWSFYLATLAKLNFSNPPEMNFWRIDRSSREAKGYTAFEYSKTKWAAGLILNTRGIRWNHQVKNVSTKPKQTKFSFLVSQAFEVAKNLLFADFLFQMGIRLFYTAPDGRVGQMNSKFMTMRHEDWRWSIAKAFVFGATSYFTMSMQYAQFAFAAILLGFSQPEVSVFICCLFSEYY
jgi:hypothetical protein